MCKNVDSLIRKANFFFPIILSGIPKNSLQNHVEFSGRN